MRTMHLPGSNNGTRTFPPASLAGSSVSVASCQLLVPVMLVLFLFEVLSIPAASSAASNSQSSKHTRPCSSNPSLPPDSKLAAESTETPAAPPNCLELKGDSIELQGLLHVFIRGQKWRISQEQASAQGLSFVLYLEPEELARFAHTEILGGRIGWTEGKAGVHVTTAKAADGFTRVQISAKFQGRGDTSERFARPTDHWPLASKGILEGSMIAALESHFRSLP